MKFSVEKYNQMKSSKHNTSNKSSCMIKPTKRKNMQIMIYIHITKYTARDREAKIISNYTRT